MPLLGELSRSSQDSFESDSDSNESWDNGPDSPKVPFSNFCIFFESIDRIERTNQWIDRSIVSIEGHGVHSLVRTLSA